MKTTRLLKRKLSQALCSLALLAVTIIFLNGCKKEELSTPVSNQETVSNSIPKNIGGYDQILLFRTIIIDHRTGRSLMPNYMVTITDDGMVKYVGRANVRTLGTMEFKVHPSALYQISAFSSTMNFFEIKTNTQSEFEVDHPMTVTTYLPSLPETRPVTLFDNGQKPEVLISYRNKIEALLNISSLIH